MHNPNSAVERIKNHLAYKLGQTMIEYNKNGGGYLSLFKKLYNIKKQHKKEKQIYQKTIKVFPTLKYPELKQCPDYNEALKCYFHLSYMLGEVLIKADQDKFIGGYFNLNKYIKKAKKEFKLFQDIFKEFEQINSNIIKAIANNKQLFLKEFPKIKNLLNIHKDYQPIIDNIFHNFDYVTKNFNLIEEWLLSNDFNEKYKKENHPYPSLLDPKKLNDEKEEINYKSIPAELAWEMNLPLPDGYKFI
ncbi:sugar transferase, partial [Campylobacter sp. RM12397]|nr:sugar transferase [Campylobacter sp. RM12397]